MKKWRRDDAILPVPTGVGVGSAPGAVLRREVKRPRADYDCEAGLHNSGFDADILELDRLDPLPDAVAAQPEMPGRPPTAESAM